MTVVGLDVGTSGVKGIALDADGTVAARATRGYGLLTPQPGWAEQDPDDWWRAAAEVLDELRSRVGPPQGIGLSGQMHGLVALDSADRPLRPAILWNDQRSQAECEEIEERIGLERLIALTGNRALTGFTAPKLLWLRNHEPETYERIASILLPKDYVRLKLTGEHASDVADSSGTLLFDVAARRWSDEVTTELEIPMSWLPPALESSDISGRTNDNVPVAAGAGDQAAGALGGGITEPGPLSVVLGTSGVVFGALDRYRPDPLARTQTFCHAVPGTWHAMGVMQSAAGSLDWLRTALGGDVAFDVLLAEAEAWEPGAEGLVFLPYLAGERTPHADPEARASFTGLTLRHTRGALVRAVLEGVCFGLRDCLDVLAQSGVTATAGIASGGGAASDLWLKIAASVLDLPLSRTAVGDGAAFGAALLGGVAAGTWADVHEAAQATVRITDTIEPDPGWSGRYAQLHDTFRALYPAIRHASDPPHPSSPAAQEVTP
jgi:xylulokinase